MINLIYFLILLLLYLVDAKERKIWGVLVLMSLLLNVNSYVFPNDYGSPLYYIRSFIVFLTCIYLLNLSTNKIHAYYQSIICVLTLILFGLLEYDVFKGSNLVYSNYEDFIHGIMAIRIMGFILGFYERLCVADCDNTSNRRDYL